MTMTMMYDPSDACAATHTVIINDEGQYSVWLLELSVPVGWIEVEFCGSEEGCLDYIEENWKDMRPQSLRM